MFVKRNIDSLAHFTKFHVSQTTFFQRKKQGKRRYPVGFSCILHTFRQIFRFFSCTPSFSREKGRETPPAAVHLPPAQPRAASKIKAAAASYSRREAALRRAFQPCPLPGRLRRSQLQTSFMRQRTGRSPLKASR